MYVFAQNVGVQSQMLTLNLNPSMGPHVTTYYVIMGINFSHSVRFSYLIVLNIAAPFGGFASQPSPLGKLHRCTFYCYFVVFYSSAYPFAPNISLGNRFARQILRLGVGA